MRLEIFAWVADTRLADWVISSPFIWPTLESIHFASLCVLFGSLLVIDLRLVGFIRQPCAPLVQVLIRLSLVAFAVNLATGVLFFAGNAFKYIDNPAFELKLVLIGIAGANALYFRLRLSEVVTGNAVNLRSMTVGYLSLLLWAGVIICGRMITFYAP